MGKMCFKSDIEWLGFKISADGVRPLVGKADAIKNLPIPKNISELRSFFGSINQYVKFVPNLSTLSFPLRPKAEIVNITDNSHFVIKKEDKTKNRCFTQRTRSDPRLTTGRPVESNRVRVKIFE